jgi:hypothetical protein
MKYEFSQVKAEKVLTNFHAIFCGYYATGYTEIDFPNVSSQFLQVVTINLIVATTPAFRCLVNSSFNNHPTVRRSVAPASDCVVTQITEHTSSAGDLNNNCLKV